MKYALKSRKLAALLLVLILAAPLPASAGTKEQLIQIQTQIQALQDQMARMQQSFDERMGVMRNLVEQTTDSVNRMNTTLGSLDKGLKTTVADSGGKVDQLSTQVQSLQDSVDELKTRIARVSKQLEDMQAAQQTLNTASLTSTQVPPADVLYNNALRDYNAAKYDLAQQQFSEYMRYYSTTELAGNAQFYVADILFRKGDFGSAVTEYDKVLEQFPGGNKAQAAQLKKGYALLELGQRDAGVRELRSLVSRYPRSAEATQARERLARLGASPSAAKPSPKRRANN